MSKNLTTALLKGNLKPKDRVLLLVHNAVKKELTGKEVLSEAEIHAISDGWQPLNNEQVKEYNRYNQGWKLAGFAELDAQTAYLETKIIFYRERQVTWHLISYPFFRDAKKWLERLEDIQTVNIEQAQDIMRRQREEKLKEGLDFDYAVYLLAVESLDKALREDLETLDGDAHYETSYLDDEEELYNLFKGKEALTAEDKDKLTESIVMSGYNKYAKEWQLWQSYASIPLKVIGKKWLDKRDIKLQNVTEYGLDDIFQKARQGVEKVRNTKLSLEEAVEDYTAENITYELNRYAKDHKTTPEAELKAIVREWLDNGLLNDFVPLFKSKSTKTYNGDTKLVHDELFKRWLEAKAKARETLKGLVAEGKLKQVGDTITGESIYTFKGDYQFIKDEQKHIDEYQANLGIVYADDDPEHKGKHLDRELLITDLNKEGKPHGINVSQLALSHIKNYFDLTGVIDEKEINGERIIEFNDIAKDYGELLKNTTEGLKKQYGVLLAFREVFKRLSKTYGIDLTYKVSKWLTEADGFIDSHNKDLALATKKGIEEIHQHKTVRLKDDLVIDKATIQPDTERVAEYYKELGETLGEDF